MSRGKEVIQLDRLKEHLIDLAVAIAAQLVVDWLHNRKSRHEPGKHMRRD